MKRKLLKLSSAFAIALFTMTSLQADPCGMVPPIYIGDQSPISRIGLQKTYVFHKGGVETFVIRPGFSGKVDNFGMLIPFPTPPEIRKVPDNIFEQVANAIDPPEVVVDLRIRRLLRGGGAGGLMPAAAAPAKKMSLGEKKLTVLKQEAVGMYEVAVLEAGSAAVLKKWMDENGYKYPAGMDKVTNDYVQLGWCFVAVKTQVGKKSGVDPKPGQRNVRPQLPDGSVFDGNVQGMGFRFKSDELVVPMRLSAFNDGDLRNVVYLLTDGPRKIRAIPEEYVVRQLSGNQLFQNVTRPLPLRIIGGTEKDIPAFQRRNLDQRRDPLPKNGLAKDLFAADLLAVSSGQMSLKHEEEEKELLRIGEYLGLRGKDIDRENAMALAEERSKTTDKGLDSIKGMTMTVVDGDFPRQVIANENLTFVQYKMPQSRNDALNYDANRFGPGTKKEGILKVGAIDWQQVDFQIAQASQPTPDRYSWLLGVGLLAMIGVFVFRRPRAALLVGVGVALIAGSTMAAVPILDQDEWIAQLENSKTAKQAIDQITAFAKSSEENREAIIQDLLKVVKTDESLTKRGWAIAALAEIRGQDIDEYLLNVHADENQEQIVRTWAAAARVSMTRTVNGLIEKANLIPKFPALGRPIGMRIVEKMSKDASQGDPEKVLGVTQKVPQLQEALASTIMAYGPEKLTKVMITAKETNIRRLAAAYLGTLSQQGRTNDVAKEVAKQLAFDLQASEVPWAGGALFVPGIQWPKEEAREMVGQLIRWNLWCDIRRKSQEQRQIHNNIRSLGLAKAAGYTSPGWNDVDCVAWLKAWGEAVGREELQAILKEQDVDDDTTYSAALKNLSN